MREKVVITAGRRIQKDNIALAKKISKEWDIPYIFRGTDSIEEIKLRENAEFVIVAKEKGLILETSDGEFFFHPNLAHLRLKNLRLGKGDYLVEALDLSYGSKVLDCTLGFGADAIIESYAVGSGGKVVALEKKPLIAKIIGYGLSHATGDNYDMQEAMRRIEVIESGALEFLKTQKDNSFDAVYFDPMFRHPLNESENLRPIRCIAESEPISRETIEEAKRVAKNRVVLKENARSLEFQRLGFSEFVGGKYSKIKYGIIKNNF